MTGKEPLTNTKINVNNTGMKNRNNYFLCLYIFGNGMSVGILAKLIKYVNEHGLDDNTAALLIMTTGAFCLSAHRILAIMREKYNQKQK